MHQRKGLFYLSLNLLIFVFLALRLIYPSSFWILCFDLSLMALAFINFFTSHHIAAALTGSKGKSGVIPVSARDLRWIVILFAILLFCISFWMLNIDFADHESMNDAFASDVLNEPLEFFQFGYLTAFFLTTPILTSLAF